MQEFPQYNHIPASAILPSTSVLQLTTPHNIKTLALFSSHLACSYSSFKNPAHADFLGKSFNKYLSISSSLPHNSSLPQESKFLSPGTFSWFHLTHLRVIMCFHIWFPEQIDSKTLPILLYCFSYIPSP